MAENIFIMFKRAGGNKEVTLLKTHTILHHVGVFYRSLQNFFVITSVIVVSDIAFCEFQIYVDSI